MDESFIRDEDLIQSEADWMNEILEICLEIDNFGKD